MPTTLYTHESCFEHDPGPLHPESPQRLRAILAALAGPDFRSLDRRQAPQADLTQIEPVHPRPYIDHVLAEIPVTGHHALDPDTIVSPDSGVAALHAVGALIAATDDVMTGATTNAFCAVRPPGHHAEPGRVMGFCLFNSVAIAAVHARAVYGIERVAVVDFDVHHGNGTQAAFTDDPNLFYASTHQSPHYPGTGSPHERGIAGNIVNAPLAPGAGSVEFRRAITDIVLPQLVSFNPELLLISAGFDAHTDDPLAQLNVTTQDFGWVTRELMAVADQSCDGRIVSTLEGGYDLDALAASAAIHLAALMDG